MSKGAKGKAVKKFKITVNDKTYNVEVGDVRSSPVTVKVDGEEFQVQVEQEPVAKPVTITVPLSAIPGPPVSAGEVIAPMPGTVMDIMVRVGDEVKTGQHLCNLEAMKMKSPIRATADGRVIDVRVYDGKSVNYGDVLFVLAVEQD